MRTAFATSHGTETFKHATIVEAVVDGVSGWGECAALEHPTYTDEFADGAFAVLADRLAPAALRRADWATTVPGNPMAKAGLELAILDASLRGGNTSLIAHLEAGRDGAGTRRQVPAGISFGIIRDLGRLLDEVARAVETGYRRIRMKIDRDWDHRPLEAIRRAFPSIAIQVDANGCYTLDDLDVLVRLQDIGLLMIEQPLAAHDLVGHAELARRLTTPLCLDEPIVDPQSARTALTQGACKVINIKVARLGGLVPTLATLDVCREMHAGAWLGGMLDTGIGRAVNIAVAALDGFTSPGDIAATDRYFDRDIITTVFTVENGTIGVPDGAGIGVDVDSDALRHFTTRQVVLPSPTDSAYG